jgi:hypothetical protein
MDLRHGRNYIIVPSTWYIVHRSEQQRS